MRKLATFVAGVILFGGAWASVARGEDGKALYTKSCVSCHGATGKGDGPASAPLNPKPRDLTDKKWQASVDDAHIETVILKGGAAVKLSPMMAANPDLESKPDVIRALRAKVRSLGGK